jgi:hypothetical protein
MWPESGCLLQVVPNADFGGDVGLGLQLLGKLHADCGVLYLPLLQVTARLLEASTDLSPVERFQTASLAVQSESTPQAQQAVSEAFAALPVTMWPFVPQRTEAWHELRKQCLVTASSIFSFCAMGGNVARGRHALQLPNLHIPAFRRGVPPMAFKCLVNSVQNCFVHTHLLLVCCEAYLAMLKGCAGQNCLHAFRLNLLVARGLVSGHDDYIALHAWDPTLAEYATEKPQQKAAKLWGQTKEAYGLLAAIRALPNLKGSIVVETGLHSCANASRCAQSLTVWVRCRQLIIYVWEMHGTADIHHRYLS